MLEIPVTDNDNVRALMDIGDLKAHDIDGFGAEFYKASQSTVKHGVIAAIMDFFNNNKMYPAINSTLVTLVPKGNTGRTIKEFRSISCCTIIYKIISKILT